MFGTAMMGCNPILMTAYLLNRGEDPKMAAEFPLKPQPDRKKEPVKVVVLTSCAPGVPAELINVDRLLASDFIPLLEGRCQANKENVVIKKSQPIEEFKRENPDWRNMHPLEIGKHFQADYVIDIEVLSISMYEVRSRQLMKGRARIAMSAYDCSRPIKEPAYNPSEFIFDYPTTHAVSIDDVPPTAFRQRFVKRIANDLVLPFTAHTSNQMVNVD
jgi:hypothetical protein